MEDRIQMQYYNDLEAALGKDIKDICKNKFHGKNYNHCAHFVSHIAGIEFSYHCREYKGGSKQPANVRVHEIFAQCPRVGREADLDKNRESLIFVTKEKNVDLEKKNMVNIPQKHVGIFSRGNVYHYSNGGDKVIKEPLSSFKTKFQNLYSGHQAIFFGHFPNEGYEIDVRPDGINVSAGVPIEIQKGDNRWWARATKASSNKNDWFLVGKEIKKKSAKYYGLFVPIEEYYGHKYSAKSYEDDYDIWSHFLEVSGYCESNNHFNLHNTYDRAKFTFGFYQLAAHTPNDNFVLFLRDLIKEGVSEPYFPELSLINGRVHKVSNDGAKTDLETIFDTGPNGSKQLQLLMNYFNPNRWELDNQEVLNAARMMHMCEHSKKARDIQVKRSVQILESKMSKYGGWYDLDGKSAKLCMIIADIHHQGRASRKKVKNALNSGDPINNLIDINSKYKSRSKSLRTALDRLDNDILNKKYVASLNEFK